ncbi:hypothetical protein NEOKW01_0309 [Nematocida sp. AWRm80]|nr:hypothetical protein NEOKW01_0309 [Nematocida sp. AWRm80]
MYLKDHKRGIFMMLCVLGCFFGVRLASCSSLKDKNTEKEIKSHNAYISENLQPSTIKQIKNVYSLEVVQMLMEMVFKEIKEDIENKGIYSQKENELLIGYLNDCIANITKHRNVAKNFIIYGKDLIKQKYDVLIGQHEYKPYKRYILYKLVLKTAERHQQVKKDKDSNKNEYKYIKSTKTFITDLTNLLNSTEEKNTLYKTSFLNNPPTESMQVIDEEKIKKGTSLIMNEIIRLETEIIFGYIFWGFMCANYKISTGTMYVFPSRSTGYPKFIKLINKSSPVTVKSLNLSDLSYRRICNFNTVNMKRDLGFNRAFAMCPKTEKQEAFQKAYAAEEEDREANSSDSIEILKDEDLDKISINSKNAPNKELLFHSQEKLQILLEEALGCVINTPSTNPPTKVSSKSKPKQTKNSKPASKQKNRFQMLTKESSSSDESMLKKPEEQEEDPFITNLSDVNSKYIIISKASEDTIQKDQEKDDHSSDSSTGWEYTKNTRLNKNKSKFSNSDSCSDYDVISDIKFTNSPENIKDDYSQLLNPNDYCDTKKPIMESFRLSELDLLLRKINVLELLLLRSIQILKKEESSDALSKLRNNYRFPVNVNKVIISKVTDFVAKEIISRYQFVNTQLVEIDSRYLSNFSILNAFTPLKYVPGTDLDYQRDGVKAAPLPKQAYFCR